MSTNNSTSTKVIRGTLDGETIIVEIGTNDASDAVRYTYQHFLDADDDEGMITAPFVAGQMAHLNSREICRLVHFYASKVSA